MVLESSLDLPFVILNIDIANELRLHKIKCTYVRKMLPNSKNLSKTGSHWLILEQDAPNEATRNCNGKNCWNLKTTHKILTNILVKMGQPVHDREPTDDLVTKFEKLAKKKIIVCLDEADQLKDTSVLYNLARSNTAVVLIANSEYLLATLDPRISSSLWLKHVRFKKYTANELLDILKERASYALKPNVADSSMLRIVAHIANGDARIALQTLRNAAKAAERKNMDKITINEIKDAIKDATLSKRSYHLTKLNAHERLLFGILEINGRMKSGQLYSEYCSQVDYPLKERAYRANMNRLAERGLVVAQGEGKGRVYCINHA